MTKRKTSAVRQPKESQYGRRRSHMENKFQPDNSSSKTIDFVPQPKKSKKPVELIPQSVNQEKYIVALTNPDIDIVTVSGPAGTGKTYVAMVAAIKALKQGTCEKILLTRPKVAVDDEDHGFLPGDLNQKMEPWVRPLFDVLKEFYSTSEIEYMIQEQIIEITPLAYCRGRTFKHCWVICDEMQNSSIAQCKMILTRIGVGCKIMITGDVEQTDRPSSNNGLLDLVQRINNNPTSRMTLCEFTEKDVRRHSLIPHILNMYR